MRSSLMSRAALLALMGLTTTAAFAEVPTGYTVKELATCQAGAAPYRTPASATAGRIRSAVIVVVKASANCSAEIQPVVTQASGRMAIQLDERYTPGAPAVGCNCMRTFKITFTQPVAKGTRVYLVRYGKATQLARVP